jgi:hypothetical protein
MGMPVCRIAVTLRSLRSARSSAASPSAQAGRLARSSTVPAPAATTGPPMPPGCFARAWASPPAGSRQSAASASSPSPRVETNSREPSGRKAGEDSPRSDQVRRRAGCLPSGSISQSAGENRARIESGSSMLAIRRLPSGLSARPETRGSAVKAADSAKDDGCSDTRQP